MSAEAIERAFDRSALVSKGSALVSEAIAPVFKTSAQGSETRALVSKTSALVSKTSALVAEGRGRLVEGRAQAFAAPEVRKGLRASTSPSVKEKPDPVAWTPRWICREEGERCLHGPHIWM